MSRRARWVGNHSSASAAASPPGETLVCPSGLRGSQSWTPRCTLGSYRWGLVAERCPEAADEPGSPPSEAPRSPSRVRGVRPAAGDVLAGQSRVAVLRGEAGVGKSALLGYLSAQVAGWCVARAAGVESEMELAHAGLHQLCAPLLDHLGRLPAPQRNALTTVFGLSSGASKSAAAPGSFRCDRVVRSHSTYCSTASPC